MTTDLIIEKKKVTNKKLQEPKKYKVIICNDDVTPVDFVITLLMSIFRHNEQNAKELTIEVHYKGSAVAGIYNYEIAEQKAIEGINLSRTNGFPLILKVEEE